MSQKQNNLSKKIWFLWLQGYKKMPELVRKCYESWCQHHPDWEIIFLDEDNINAFVEVRSLFEDRNTKIYRVSQSEVIRINLLDKYGGVWVDATSFCMRPLDEWLFEYMAVGFFAFNRPGIDRMFSSWFLAATKGNELVHIYCKKVNQFWPANKSIKLWIDRPFIHQFLLKFKIHGILKRNPTLWYHPVFLNILKIYPYFWFFYLFEKSYQENQTIREIWDQMPKLTADIPHKIYHFGFFKPISDAIKMDIDNRVDPLYKLSFKYEATKLKPGCTLDYLLKLKC